MENQKPLALVIVFISFISACSSPQTKTISPQPVLTNSQQTNAPEATPSPQPAEDFGPPVPMGPIPEAVAIPDSVPTTIPGPLTIIIGPGLSRSAAAIGFLKVLEEEKIPMERIVGVEAGALYGGIYALMETQNKVDWIVQKLKQDDFTGSAKSLTQKLQTQLTQKEISRSRISLALFAVCNGEMIQIEKGPAPEGLRAAVANSQVIDQSDWDQKKCSSSEMTSAYPVDEIRATTKHPIVVLDFLAELKDNERIDSYFNQVRVRSQKQRDLADLVIQVATKNEFMDFSKPGEVVYSGKKAARAHLDELRTLSTAPINTPTPEPTP